MVCDSWLTQRAFPLNEILFLTLNLVFFLRKQFFGCVEMDANVMPERGGVEGREISCCREIS